VGGFDLIYRNAKRVKNGLRNSSFLGCQNNRHQQLRKMAKTVALRLAEHAKEERAKEQQREEKARENLNARNRSNNAPSNHNIRPPNASTSTGTMNRSGNNIPKPESQGPVKLPKVNPISSSSVSNTSMKAVSTGSKEESRK
jgi:septum formation inhibitor MinC